MGFTLKISCVTILKGELKDKESFDCILTSASIFRPKTNIEIGHFYSVVVNLPTSQANILSRPGHYSVCHCHTKVILCPQLNIINPVEVIQ